MNKDISRLSIYRIETPLFRGLFLQEVTKPDLSWDQWELSADELKRADLVASRYYGTTAPEDIVATIIGMDSPGKTVTQGSRHYLPPPEWIRQRLKHYEQLEKGAGGG